MNRRGPKSKNKSIINSKNAFQCFITFIFFIMIYANFRYNVIDSKTSNTKKKSKLRPVKVEEQSESMGEKRTYDSILDPEEYMSEDGCDFSAVVKLFEPNKLEINCGNIHELTRGEKLGQGYWRKVYEANWKGRQVAVKVVRKKLLSRSDIIKRHVKEAAVLYQLRHAPNIVHLVGWCNTTVVVEYVPDKLEDLVFEKENKLSVKRSLELALDAARGIEQLHAVQGGPFAHTDIQTRQMLLNSEGRLLVNDFNRMKYTGVCLLPGMSNQKCLFKTPVAKGKWRSPEEYSNSDLDEKLDIYSLSVVLWTLRSRVHPFEGMEKVEVYRDVVQKDIRPDVSLMSDYPEKMQELIKEGWDRNPEKRPSAKELADRIEKILGEYTIENRN